MLITLESGIDIGQEINVGLCLKFFHIMILIHFYINLGIAVILCFVKVQVLLEATKLKKISH